MARVPRGVLMKRASAGKILLCAAALVCAWLLCGCSKASGPEAYIARLGDPDGRVRRSAVDELIRMREDALPAVIELVRKAPATDRGVRELQAAVDVLSSVKTLEGLEAVASRMDDPDPRVRLAAVRGVGNLAGVRKRMGVELLRRALQDPDPECVRAAAMGLREVASEDATAVLEQTMQAGQGVAAVFAAEALYRADRRSSAAEFLVESLSSPEEQTQAAARRAVNELGDLIVEPLAGYLTQHPDAREQQAALEQVRDGLLKELGGLRHPARVQQVVHALQLIGDEQCARRLIAIISQGQLNLAAQVAAAEALGEAASSDRPAGTREELRRAIREALRKQLGNERADVKLRIACAIALCRLEDAEGVQYLLAQLGSLEQAAAGEQELTELRVRAQEALTASGKFVVPYLIAALRKPDAGEITRWAAAKTLAELRVKEATADLARLLTATTSAADVQPRPSDPVFKLRISGRREPFEPTRRTVLEAVFGNEPVIPESHPSVRIAAAFALGRIGGEEALSALRRALTLHQSVRDRVAEFLRHRRTYELVPPEATDEKQKSAARDAIAALCECIIREQERVLFYIRLGLKTARAQG